MRGRDGLFTISGRFSGPRECSPPFSPGLWGDLVVEVKGQMPHTLGEIGEIWEKVETGDVVRLGFMRVNGFSMRQWTTNVRAE